MSKTRDTGFLGNVVKVANNGDISLMHGSTMLMQISSSGAITTTGVISGSVAANATSASYAANTSLLNGSGSGEFVPTGSFNTFSSSILTYTGSADSRLGSLETTSGSNITRIAALEVTSGSNITRISALETASGSAITRLSSLESRTGSYATTGSNTFVDGQYLSSSFNPTGFSTTASLYTDGGLRVTKDAYISGTLYLNNVTVYGTQSVCYITSSQLNIASNLITVNTATPSVQFGGLAVYDSGSSGLTGSILWDSTNNHWVYSNPSGSSYSGGMFISGPRSAALGSETGTTSCMLLAGQGGDHLTSSMIYHSSTVTCIPTAIVGGSTACFASTVCAGGHVSSEDVRIYRSAGTTTGYINFGSTGTNYFGFDGTKYVTNGAISSTNGLFSGCIGIGATTVGAQLHIEKGGSDIDIKFTDIGVGSYMMGLRDGCARFEIASGNCLGTNTALSIDTSGRVGIGTTAGTYSLNVAGRGYFFATNQDAGWGMLTLDYGNGDNSNIYAIQFKEGNAINSAIGYGSYSASSCGDIIMWTNNGSGLNERLRMYANGITNFTCQICVPTITLGTNANNIFTRSNGTTYCRFLYSGACVNVVFTGGTTAQGGAFGVNNYEDTERIFNVTNDGVAYHSNTVCSSGRFISNVGATTGTYGFTHCGSGRWGRIGMPNTSFMYLETNSDAGVYIDAKLQVANNVCINGAMRSSTVCTISSTFAGSVICASQVRIGNHNLNTAYEGDGIWGTNATPSYIIGTGYNGGFYLGYRDNGSGLYGAAYGFDVSYRDGLNNAVDYDALVMRNSGQGTRPFRVTSYGNIYGNTKNFRIKHPIPSMNDTHYLVHTSIEGPQADLIYRGKVQLLNGKAEVNIDTASRMTDGTFELLCQDVQSYTTNESGWSLTKSYVVGNILHIEAQDETANDVISWLVIGERNDDGIKNSAITDKNGHVIVEEIKPEEGL